MTSASPPLLCDAKVLPSDIDGADGVDTDDELGVPHLRTHPGRMHHGTDVTEAFCLGEQLTDIVPVGDVGDDGACFDSVCGESLGCCRELVTVDVGKHDRVVSDEFPGGSQSHAAGSSGDDGCVGVHTSSMRAIQKPASR